MKHAILAMLCGVALAGCSGLRSSRSVEQVYVLHAAPAAAAGQAIAGVLRVPRPEVQPGLDTPRIALTQADNELAYFADSRWGESLPKVLAAFAVESMVRSGRFEAVVGAVPATVPGDFELLLTVRHFEAAYVGGAPSARVSLDCVLLGGARKQVLGRCDAEAVEPAGENRLGPIVGAMERAAQKAMRDVAGRAAALAGAVRK